MRFALIVDFLNRVKSNAAAKKEAKAAGGSSLLFLAISIRILMSPPPCTLTETIILKRFPAAPREARNISTVNNIPQTLTPIPYGTLSFPPSLEVLLLTLHSLALLQTPQSKVVLVGEGCLFGGRCLSFWVGEGFGGDSLPKLSSYPFFSRRSVNDAWFGGSRENERG